MTGKAQVIIVAERPADAELAYRMTRYGAFHYVTKPLERRHVLSVVDPAAGIWRVLKSSARASAS